MTAVFTMSPIQRSFGTRVRGAVGRALVAIGLLAWLGVAVAQFEVTGTIEGTIDGENRTWYTLEYASEEGLDGTAWLNNYGNDVFTMMFLEVQAHDEPRYKTQGTLTLGGSLTQDLADCPCVLGEPDIMYFTSTSMFADVFTTIDAELIIESAEAADDGTIRLVGTFTALLGFVENALQGTDPDPESTILVEGSFDLERVLRNE